MILYFFGEKVSLLKERAPCLNALEYRFVHSLIILEQKNSSEPPMFIDIVFKVDFTKPLETTSMILQNFMRFLHSTLISIQNYIPAHVSTTFQ
jgi:hypothetical protein